jgi:hypothetical protein
MRRVNYLNEWRVRKEAGNSAAIHCVAPEFGILINLENEQQFVAILQKFSDNTVAGRNSYRSKSI